MRNLMLDAIRVGEEMSKKARKTMRRIVIAAGFVFMVALLLPLIWSARPTDAQAQRREVPPSREAVQYTYAPIVRKAAPAVVNVYVRSRVKTFVSPFARDPFFRHFFGDRFGDRRERMQNALGSGVIVSPDGIVVTNTHVVKASGKTEIRVALSDQREFDARILTQDEKTDITILKIEAKGEEFPFMKFENSDNLEVGDLVLAIGNPFAVGQTVTSGIVSALARSQIESEAVFIQTDAAINPGNSGGALVDMSGRLVGINTAIFSRSGGSNGIGFAIPSNLVRLFVESARSGKEVVRPWLGARLEDITRDIAEALGLSRRAGAVVTRIYNDAPADRAGLEPGDVITHVDGFEVVNARSVTYRLTTRGVGKSTKLKVMRKGKPVIINVRLNAPPKPKQNDIRNLSGDHPFDGARVQNILPPTAEELDLNSVDGVVILAVRRGGIARQLGFRAGDVILKVAGQEIRNVKDLQDAVQRPKRYWRISFQRNGRVNNVTIRG